MIYLDQAATSFLKPPEVAKAVYASFEELGNAGRGAHAPTLHASRLLYDTREKLAELLGISDPSRIAFTCNATEALNIAICGICKPGHHVISTVCEHNSVLRPLYQMENQGMELTLVSADEKGRIDYQELEDSLRSNTKAVVITHGSNVTGNVTDLERAAAFTRNNGLLLVVDASQTAGSIPIAAEKTGIDEVYAKLMPQDKLDRLMQIREKHGNVMFVGDGINDAPVLAGADVGAAMGSGADAAIEAADVVFMTSSMDAIPQAIDIARATSAISWQNVYFALAVKVVVMAMGLFGYANMWLAVFADTGVSMLCLLNSMRILYRK